MSIDPFRLVHRKAAPVIWDLARAIDNLTRAAGGSTWIGRGWSPDSEEHATGRALDVIISARVGKLPTAVEVLAGDLLAAWLIRHADTLHVRHILWRRRIWRRRRAAEGWRPLPGRTSASSPSDWHDDHIHLLLDDTAGRVPSNAPLAAAPPPRKETNMARTISDDDVTALVEQLLTHPVQANGKRDALVQHLAEGFVADAAQSRALHELNGRLSDVAGKLGALVKLLESAK